MAGEVVVLERREDQEQRVDGCSASNQVLKTAVGKATHPPRSYVRPSPGHKIIHLRSWSRGFYGSVS